MIQHEFKQNAYYLIYLIRCVLHYNVPAKEKLDKMNLTQLYEGAKAHSLTAMTAYALESADYIPDDFKQAKYKAIRKSISYDIERESVFRDFEKAEIWYVPLKGTILKEIYPQIGMREMCDNDILFDPTKADEVNSIMESHGFESSNTHTGHDIVFHKLPFYNFEMHYSLFSNYKGSRVYKYFSDISERLIGTDSFRRDFTNEDFYLYMTAHEHHHFIGSGTGLRSLVDAYVFLDKYSDSLDWEYVNRELSEIGIYEYEHKRRNLVSKLFDGKKLNDDEKELLDYYIFSSTYGTLNNRVKNKVNKNNSKIKYAISRLFLSLDTIKNVYPYFYEHKILIPFLPAYRIVTSIRRKNHHIKTELKTLIKL